MARIVSTALVIVLLNVLVGCRDVDSGRSQIVPTGVRRTVGPGGVVDITKVGETDLVEQMAVNRQAYRQSLELLLGYYTRAGNNMKLQWAKKELEALITMPKYDYIPEAPVARSDLQGGTSIPQADDVYYDAVELDKKAGPLSILRNENLLRLALDKYKELISKYPSSDKIDDAAYKAGEICEYFKDYSIALLYYKRSYQWDPETTYPARFRSARILDKYLHRNAEAVELYQQAIATEGKYDKYREWREFAQERLSVLQKIDEDID